jgi:hypothetical protein
VHKNIKAHYLQRHKCSTNIEKPYRPRSNLARASRPHPHVILRSLAISCFAPSNRAQLSWETPPHICKDCIWGFLSGKIGTHTHTNPTFLPPTCCYVLSKCVTTQNQFDYSAPATTVPCSTCFHAGKKIIPSPSTNSGSVSAKLTWPPLVWSHVHRSLI